MGDAKTKDKPGLPEVEAVQSNHNSMTDPKPVGVAFLAERPDYNPMRRMPNKANIASDTTGTRETAEALIGEKGDRPYRATIEANAETIAETSAAPDVVKERAPNVSVEAGRAPSVHADILPSDVSADTVPATDSGNPGSASSAAATGEAGGKGAGAGFGGNGNA